MYSSAPQSQSHCDKPQANGPRFVVNTRNSEVTEATVICSLDKGTQKGGGAGGTGGVPLPTSAATAQGSTSLPGRAGLQCRSVPWTVERVDGARPQAQGGGHVSPLSGGAPRGTWKAPRAVLGVGYPASCVSHARARRTHGLVYRRAPRVTARFMYFLLLWHNRHSSSDRRCSFPRGFGKGLEAEDLPKRTKEWRARHSR